MLEPELRVMAVTAEKPEDLKRAAVLLRALRPDQGPGPFGKGKREMFVRKERPGGPKNRRSSPGPCLIRGSSERILDFGFWI